MKALKASLKVSLKDDKWKELYISQMIDRVIDDVQALTRIIKDPSACIGNINNTDEEVEDEIKVTFEEIKTAESFLSAYRPAIKELKDDIAQVEGELKTLRTEKVSHSWLEQLHEILARFIDHLTGKDPKAEMKAVDNNIIHASTTLNKYLSGTTSHHGFFASNKERTVLKDATPASPTALPAPKGK